MVRFEPTCIKPRPLKGVKGRILVPGQKKKKIQVHTSVLIPYVSRIKVLDHIQGSINMNLVG